MTPRYVTALFVGGPKDGELREVVYRTRYVVDVWTPADFEVRPADPFELVVPIKLFHYTIHVLAGGPGPDGLFYVYAPEGWTGTQVMEALILGYRKSK